jgi:hypothetical protein
MLVAVVVYVKVKRDHADEARAGVAATARALAAAAPAEVDPSLAAPVVVPGALASLPTATAPAAEPVLPAPKGPSTAGESRRQGAPSRKPARAPAAASPTPAPAAQPTGGIPSTRD